MKPVLILLCALLVCQNGMAQVPVCSVISNVTCNGGSDGSASVSVTGGAVPYSYKWSNGATTNSVSGLKAGTYSVFITDANSSVGIATVAITEPTAVTISGTVTNVTCNGWANGSISTNISGGSAPTSWLYYTAVWSNGTYSAGGNWGLTAGQYSVVAKDPYGCSATADFSVTQPDALVGSGVVTAVANYGASTGAIDFSVTGGTSPYTYSWTNGATTEDISAIPAGVYLVTTTDAQSCQTTNFFSVSQPYVPIVATAKISNVTTYGGSNGSITLSVIGGTAPYTYNWSNGATTRDISGLIAGTYLVTISDVLGCHTDLSFPISQPSGFCGGFTTYTQGAYGATPHGGNPASYMSSHFASVFPSGLTIGCTNKIKLTSATAVINFLPSGGTPATLPSGTLTNPTTYSNTLAGQAVTLTLSLGFDNADPAFAASSTHLSQQVIVSGPLTGMTVAAALSEANNVLGGCQSIYSAATLNEVLTSINENYDGGTVNNSYLTCPIGGGRNAGPSNPGSENDLALKQNVTAYPNPFTSKTNITFSVLADGHATIEVFNAINGKKVETIYNDDVVAGPQYSCAINGDNLSSGMYIYKLSCGDKISYGKVMLVK